MVSKGNTPAKKTAKKPAKKISTKKVVKKTVSKAQAKKAVKTVSPMKAVSKKFAEKKATRTPSKKTAVRSTLKKSSPATTKTSSRTEASKKLGIISGNTFLFTGTLTEMQRKDAEALVKSNGGIILSRLSDKLDYLVVGEDAGSKLDQARKINSIKIISEKDFRRMLSSTLTLAGLKTESLKKTTEKAPKATVIVMDFEVMDEDDIEGDPDQFWDDMEEDHFFIDTNIIDKLPIFVKAKDKLKIGVDYVMRYICTSELGSKELVEKYSDQLIAFCKKPDAFYYGSISINIGQVIKKQDEQKLLNDTDIFDNDKLSNRYCITEFYVEES